MSPLLSFSQFNDTIFYKNGEYVRCQITDVNDTWILFNKYSGNLILESSVSINKVNRYTWGNVTHSYVTDSTIILANVETDSILVIKDTIAYLYNKITGLNADIDRLYSNQKIAGLNLDKAGNAVYTGIAFSIISTSCTIVGSILSLNGNKGAAALYYAGIGAGVVSFVSYLIAPGRLKKAGKELGKH